MSSIREEQCTALAVLPKGEMAPTHTHPHTHTRAHSQTPTHIHTNAHRCTQAHKPTHTDAHAHTHARAHTRAHSRTHTARPGSAFGENALLSDAPRGATVSAVSPVTLFTIGKAAFQEVPQAAVAQWHPHRPLGIPAVYMAPCDAT